MARRQIKQQQKNHLVNWSTVCTPENYGGVGIRDPIKMNLDLGAKILWRTVYSKRAWWKEIL